MTVWESIIIAVVEGVTEFLPVSSTGHMIVASSFLGVSQSDLVTSFEVIIQLGAIAAIVVLYAQRVMQSRNIFLFACIAFIPMGLIGLFFAPWIKMLFSVAVVAWAFIIGGAIFLIVEYVCVPRMRVTTTNLSAIGMREALWIGFAQMLSLVPGASRAGVTIIGGMFAGLSRRAAAEFSFVAAVPAMIAVALYDGIAHYNAIISGHLFIFVLGFVVAFITAYGAVLLFMRFLERYTFVIFGWYRIALGVILLFFFV